MSNFSNKKSISKAMSNLINSGAKEPKKLSVPKLKVEDIWDKHNNHFSPFLQNIMSNKILNLCHQYDEPTNIATAKLKAPHDPYPDDASIKSRDYAIRVLGWAPEKIDLYRTLCRLGMEYEYDWIRKIALVKYFGCTLDKNRRDSTAAKALAEVLEPLAKRGFIKGALCKLSKIRLMDHLDSNESSKKIIMTYVAVTDLGEQYLLANPTDLEFCEGGLPPKLL